MSEIEIMTDYNEGQRQFLNLASQNRVDIDLFNGDIPEIKFSEKEKDNSKPTIAYIHTGGTLMMVPSNKDSNTLSFDGAIDIPRVIEVCDAIAYIRKRYNILGIYLANIDSKEVQMPLWTRIAATIRSIYSQVDGVVIGHGTHTAEYTASATAFALQKLAIPIVITASQIPIIGYPGSDGLPNLTGAMEIAANADLAEVVVYANGKIFRGTRIRKEQDKRLDIFDDRITGPLGYFTAAGVDLRDGAIQRTRRRKHELQFAPHFTGPIENLEFTPAANITTSDIIAKSEAARGLILTSYGQGAVRRDLVPILSNLVTNGFPILIASGASSSGGSRDMELHDEDAIMAHKAGVRGLYDMTRTSAITKLAHVLGNNTNPSIEEVFYEMREKSYAGEIKLPNVYKPDF